MKNYSTTLALRKTVFDFIASSYNISRILISYKSYRVLDNG